MNTIQLLKKENATLNKDSKEHKRSELITNLNKEIADLDLVVDTLRGVINDENKVDGAIVAALQKGPPRIRVQTREELKIEIKNLKAKIVKFESKKSSGNNQNDNKSEISRAETIASNFNLEEKIATVSADLIMKINDLENDLEDLRLSISGKDAEIEKYRELISRKNKDIIELNQAKIENKLILSKNNELKVELDSLRVKYETDLYDKAELELKVQELEIIEATNKKILEKNEETAKLEQKIIENKYDDLNAMHNDLLNEHNNIKGNNEDISKKFIEQKDQKKTETRILLDEIEKLKKELINKNASMAVLNKELTSNQDLILENKQKINQYMNKMVSLEQTLELEKIKVAKLQSNLRSRLISNNELESGHLSDLNESQISVKSNFSNKSKKLLGNNIF